MASVRNWTRWPLCGAMGVSQPNLASTFDHADKHAFANPDRPDDKGDGVEANAPRVPQRGRTSEGLLTRNVRGMRPVGRPGMRQQEVGWRVRMERLDRLRGGRH
jgi:hypothetical protein